MAKWYCSVCSQEFEADGTPVECPICGAGEEALEEVK